MYQPAVPVLSAEVSDLGIRSSHFKLDSNGTYVRNARGYVIGREDHTDLPVIYSAEYRGKRLYGHITDKVLVPRIRQYWDNYFGVHYTNCSAFAHYLTTGNFVACQDNDQLVIEQGMRPYEMADSVGVGDMMCILYAKKRLAASRKNAMRSYYRKICRQHHHKTDFAACSNMGIKKRSFDPSEIRRLASDGWINDYHFMVCVDKRNGQPVWMSQCGRHEVGTPEVCFAVTYGEFEPYIRDVPVLALIKKRRK